MPFSASVNFCPPTGTADDTDAVRGLIGSEMIIGGQAVDSAALGRLTQHADVPIRITPAAATSGGLSWNIDSSEDIVAGRRKENPLA
jgi:hypothetical protein